MLDRFPTLATVGVVPLGVSAHSREAEMRAAHAAPRPRAVRRHRRARGRRASSRALGRRLVYASDEYYLLAGRAVPRRSTQYDGFPQHENGIGMARTFEAEVRAALAGDPTSSADRPAVRLLRVGRRRARRGLPRAACTRRAARVHAASVERPNAADRHDHHRRVGAPVLAPLLADSPTTRRAGAAAAGANRFFGGNIGVTGLLTGADVAAALAAEPERRPLPRCPTSCSRRAGSSTARRSPTCPASVEIVPTDGASLVKALRRRRATARDR